MDGAVLSHLKHALLLDVCIAHTDQVLGNVDVAAFAGDKKGSTTVAHDLNDAAAGLARNTGTQRIVWFEFGSTKIYIADFSYRKCKKKKTN